MAFYDGFFDWLEQLYDERQSYKSTENRRRYAGKSDGGKRYMTDNIRKSTGGDDDLTRYDGLYRSVKERNDDGSGRRLPRAYERTIGSEYDPYADGYNRPRGLNPLKRREMRLEERRRLSGAQRQGHIYDDIADRLDDDNDDYIDEQPTFGIGHSSRADGGSSNVNINNNSGRGFRPHSDSRYSDSTERYRQRRYDAYYDDYDDYDDDYYDGYGRRRSTNVSPYAARRGKRRMGMGARLTLVFIVAAGICAQVVLFGSVTTKPHEPQEDIPEVDYTGSATTFANTTDGLLMNQAVEITSAMSTEQKLAQLIIAASCGSSDEDFISVVSASDAAGVLIRPDDIAGRSKESVTKLFADLRTQCGSDLLIMVEEEGGSKVTLSSNSSLRSESFRSAQSIYVSGGLDAIAADTEDKCAFLKELGVNVNLAPMCDVVTQTGGFMFGRSFGHGASDTSDYVSRVTGIMKKSGIGSVLKHFPGYGNSTGDTRNGLVVIGTVETVIRERDMQPFKAGIEAGADAVMMSHAFVSAIDDTSPASLSANVIGLLRDDLGFDGVVMCEPLDDAGLLEYTGGEDASIRAFNAGIDLLLAPEDPVAVHIALVEAVNDGRISQERVTEAARRVILWKLRLGIYQTDG